ncbi:MAG: arsenate reductase ArsC [Spirochaetota bacterium]
MDKIKVLFICVHNSARSQMAEAFLKVYGGDRFEVESAGLEPGVINPFVVEVLKEEGIDISGKEPVSVMEKYKAGKTYHYVVTVCDRSVEGKCPIFPGVTHRLNWPFDDPAAVTGTRAEKLAKVRIIRDLIKKKVQEFIDITK